MLGEHGAAFHGTLYEPVLRVPLLVRVPGLARGTRVADAVWLVDLAALLDVRPETVSRWEHDKRPTDRGSYAVLHQLLLDKLTRSTQTEDYLRGLQKPKRPPKTIEVEVEAAW